MIPVTTEHGPGVVGIISAELSRFPDFTRSLERLYVPHGTTWEWVEGVGFARNRNEIVRRMLANPKAEWLWFVDDDNTFSADALMRLLDRKVDLVQPLICNRKPPFNLHAYRCQGVGGECKSYQPASPSEVPATGLSQWDAVSTGGLLIRRLVFEVLRDPWFEEGRTKADEPGEDLSFCQKARMCSFPIHVDSDVKMGHMTKTTVSWRWEESFGQWVLEFEMTKDYVARVPVEKR